MKSPKSKEAHAVERALKILREAGYVVKKPIHYTKKTFEVAVPTLEKFRLTQEALGYKIKDAMDEALLQWAEAKEPDVSKSGRAPKGKA